jgi:hypothetical protein
MFEEPVPDMKQSILVGTFDSSCNPPRGSGAIEVVRGPTGALIEVKPNDVGNDLSDFGVFKRWLAAQTVPGEEQFQHHLRVDLVPQQMSGQGGDTRIALSFRDAVMDEPPPINAAGLPAQCPLVTGLPPRHRAGHSDGPTVVQRYISAVPAEIDTLGQPGPISDQTAGMRKIEVAPFPAGYCLDRFRQLPKLSFEAIERRIAAVLGIDIEHDEI